MRSKKLFIFLALLITFTLILAACGSTTDSPNKEGDEPAPAFDAYKDMLIPMAQEKVDAGELTTRQADYIIYLSREGKYPRGATPSFSDALDDPPEVPEDWEGPEEVKPKQ